MRLNQYIVSALIISITQICHAANSPITIPIYEKGASTFYVKAQVGDLAVSDLMIDTGSGYMMINEHSLQQLISFKQANYVKDIRGILANGAELTVPVWRITQVTISEKCIIRDIEAAVFPGNTRQILGLTALRKAAPFTISIDPPQLTLHQCISSSIKKANRN